MNYFLTRIRWQFLTPLGLWTHIFRTLHKLLFILQHIINLCLIQISVLLDRPFCRRRQKLNILLLNSFENWTVFKRGSSFRVRSNPFTNFQLRSGLFVNTVFKVLTFIIEALIIKHVSFLFRHYRRTIIQNLWCRYFSQAQISVFSIMYQLRFTLIYD